MCGVGCWCPVLLANARRRGVSLVVSSYLERNGEHQKNNNSRNRWLGIAQAHTYVVAGLKTCRVSSAQGQRGD